MLATIIRPRGAGTATGAGPVAPDGRRADVARLVAGTRFRRERFGGIAYVPARDRFFALDADHAALIRRIRRARAGAVTVAGADLPRAERLAAAGICGVPGVVPRAFYGPSIIGSLDGLPALPAPLVVNCFATSYCPLRCRYCHADDLMVPFRDGESGRWLDQVVRTAAATPAMVAVVTGGEPLARPDRARRLIEALARGKALVLDTSGVGDFEALAEALRRHRVHVRVSLDSADPAANNAVRPVNRRELGAGWPATSHEGALRTLRLAVAAGIPCSVQTVVTAAQPPHRLLDLRELVVRLGVTTWVLHTMVPAGKGGRPAQAGLLPGPGVLDDLRRLVADSRRDGIPLDIRVTGTHRAPDAVLLINARGELCVEGRDGRGKRTVSTWPVARRLGVLRAYRRLVDRPEHASRYLNGTLLEHAAATAPAEVR